MSTSNFKAWILKKKKKKDISKSLWSKLFLSELRHTWMYLPTWKEQIIASLLGLCSYQSLLSASRMWFSDNSADAAIQIWDVFSLNIRDKNFRSCSADGTTFTAQTTSLKCIGTKIYLIRRSHKTLKLMIFFCSLKKKKKKLHGRKQKEKFLWPNS